MRRPPLVLFILSATPVAALQGAYRSPRVSRTRVQRGLRIRPVPTTEDLTSATSGVALHAAAVPVSTVSDSLVAKENANFRGAVSIAGGVLAHLILGAMYCWGKWFLQLHGHLSGDRLLSSYFIATARLGVREDAARFQLH